jgi:hypothetical protein
MTDPVSSSVRPRTPVHLWIVAVLAILWHLLAVFDYLATQLELDFYLSQFTPEQLEYFLAFPAWVVSAWAIAVWGGFVGSCGLLLRKRWAVWMFGASLVGLFVSTIYNFVLTDGAAVMGTGGTVFTVVIWIVAILLLVYSMRQAKGGVLA